MGSAVTALDPVSALLFPSLARFARRTRWLVYACLAVFLFTAGLACGLVIGTYRGKVADENYQEWGRRLNVLEQDYAKHHREGRVTKAQAQVIAQQRDEARREP
jgi:hypothetical protein